MFKTFVRNKYKEICTRKNFLEIRADLKKFQFEFEEELNLLKKRRNPLVNIVPVSMGLKIRWYSIIMLPQVIVLPHFLFGSYSVAFAVHFILRPIMRLTPLKVVPTPTEPGDVCSDSGMNGCQFGQLLASVV